MNKRHRNTAVKRIAGVMIMAVLTAQTAACGKTQSDYEAQAVHMLEEKYGEEFEIYQYHGMESIEGYFKSTCYPKEEPEILFDARTACDGSYIEDGYVSAKVCNKAEKQIDENLSGVEGYLLEKVVPVSRTIDSSDADMDMNRFMERKPGNRFAVYLMYCPQEKGAGRVYENLKTAFRGLECMSGNIQLYIMGEEELKKVQNYLTETTELDYEFEKLTDKAEKITIPFEKGIIRMTEEEFTGKAGGLV